MSAEDDAADALYSAMVRLAEQTDDAEVLSVLCQSFAVLAGPSEADSGQELGVVHSTTPIDGLDLSGYWADDLRARGGLGLTPRVR